MIAEIKKISPKQIFVLSILLSIILSFTSEGFHHPDEQYYSIDFAAFKAGILDTINSWEYDTELRPWSLPYFYSLFLLIFKWFDLSPFLMASLLRAISAIIATSSLIYFSKRSSVLFKSENSYIAYLLFTHFAYFMKYMQVRSSSENLSTSFILFSIGILIPYQSKFSNKQIVLSAICGGLAFLFRHQAGFILAAIGFWLLFSKKVTLKKWSLIYLPSIILIVLIGLVIDSFGYGHLSFTPWNYLYQNLLLGKVNTFGISPFYTYLLWSFTKLTPLTPILILGSLYHFFKKRASDLLLWSIVPFLLIHHLIGHKEFRFLFPALPILILMSFVWIDSIQIKRKKTVRIIVNIFVVINCMALFILLLKPAYTPIKFYRSLYESRSNHLTILPDKNGVHPTLEMKFYLRPGLIIQNGTLTTSSGAIFAKDKANLDQLYLEGERCQILDTTYPNWIMTYNFSNWLARSNIWTLALCD